MSNSQIWQYFCKQTSKLVFPVHKYIAHTTIQVIYSQTFLNDPWKTWLGRRGTHIMFKFEPDIKNHILGQQKTLIFSFTTKSAGKEQFLVLLNFPQKSSNYIFSCPFEISPNMWVWNVAIQYYQNLNVYWFLSCLH